jgi:hypothetical protein
VSLYGEVKAYDKIVQQKSRKVHSGILPPDHDIVHAPPTAIDINVITTIAPSSRFPGTAPLQPAPAPFSANAGNVVAKSFVGSGCPLTVTVGTELSGDGP